MMTFMPATVRLNDIVEALEVQSGELSSFLNLDTGQVETIARELLIEAEAREEGDTPDLPAWQEPQWEIAKQIVFSGRFKKLPTEFEVHEWAIMKEFTDTAESAKIREDLVHALHGKDDFRHFKEVIRRRRIEPAWFTFRAEALRQIAIDWCEEHGLAWE